MKNVYLVGFMGAGKTAVGRILADKINKEFIEMDDIIEADEGRSIVDIFAQQGEAYFRRCEKKLLNDLSARKDLIIGCGGGLVCDSENLEILRDTGLVFCLKVSALTAYGRTRHQTHRPILNVDNPLRIIEELLSKRAPCYDQAHYSIDTDGISPDAVADKIIDILNK